MFGDADSKAWFDDSLCQAIGVNLSAGVRKQLISISPAIPIPILMPNSVAPFDQCPESTDFVEKRHELRHAVGDIVLHDLTGDRAILRFDDFESVLNTFRYLEPLVPPCQARR